MARTDPPEKTARPARDGGDEPATPLTSPGAEDTMAELRSTPILPLVALLVAFFLAWAILEALSIDEESGAPAVRKSGAPAARINDLRQGKTVYRDDDPPDAALEEAIEALGPEASGLPRVQRGEGSAHALVRLRGGGVAFVNAVAEGSGSRIEIVRLAPSGDAGTPPPDEKTAGVPPAPPGARTVYTLRKGAGATERRLYALETPLGAGALREHYRKGFLAAGWTAHAAYGDALGRTTKAETLAFRKGRRDALLSLYPRDDGGTDALLVLRGGPPAAEAKTHGGK